MDMNRIANNLVSTTEKGEEKQWGKGEWNKYKQEHHDTKVHPKFTSSSVASELNKIAKLLMTADVATSMDLHEKNVKKIGTSSSGKFWYWIDHKNKRTMFTEFAKFEKSLTDALDGDQMKFKKYVDELKKKQEANNKEEAKNKAASELATVANELVDKDGTPIKAETDHDKALLMIKHSDRVSKDIMSKAKAIEQEIFHARQSIDGLEKLGSAAIEAPKFLKAISVKIVSLQDYLEEMAKEIDRTI